ncbi:MULTISPECIES: TetR/AcrR family transcriptional regulator [unclassified Curtobacterium]|uniref:TetR/AcrR family transcriptional regulator n=1 Tax=unclassified Curtobacterium TaxID=257496 RepID=UPI000D99ECA0|nr:MULTISPECIES: TetR/AcrR family transcriptional regulator [unclassified Curtobacterium]PYY31617.1 TetR family transcriptional regulator [Curtobacterium sp. MCBD17_030]PZE36991.1 TetR family transcriptional regulator [Curtobacterium sp. MCPF17_031]PZF15650.1 TetR family transcriptional regulator [Curtobacterium sp. MCPF17_011]
MSPRPAPDLALRRDQITRAARSIAEAEGWEAVTMRRLASEIGVTQPVIYSAFAGGRQALIDAVALGGFDAIATALEDVPAEPLARMQAYLDFAAAQPHVYAAMFSMPSGLEFGTGTGPDALERAFAAIRAAFPGPDDTDAEVAWATVHGLATLEISGRLPATRSRARLDHAHRALARGQDRAAVPTSSRSRDDLRVAD